MPGERWLSHRIRFAPGVAVRDVRAKRRRYSCEAWLEGGMLYSVQALGRSVPQPGCVSSPSLHLLRQGMARDTLNVVKKKTNAV